MHCSYMERRCELAQPPSHTQTHIPHTHTRPRRSMSAAPSTPQEFFHLGAGKQSPAGGSTPQEEAAGSLEDASEEIMNRLVKSVTQRSPARSGPAKERRRSRGNRKSCKCCLRSLFGGAQTWLLTDVE